MTLFDRVRMHFLGETLRWSVSSCSLPLLVDKQMPMRSQITQLRLVQSYFANKSQNELCASKNREIRVIRSYSERCDGW